MRSSGRSARGVASVTLALLALAVGLVGAGAGSAQGTSACTPGASLGVELVIDDSGSMLTTDPTDLRGAAARLVIDQLSGFDSLGAITFADGPRTLIPPTRLVGADRAALKAQIDAGLFSDGGTDFTSAFTAAGAALPGLAADRRAVIFLSDGNPADPSQTAHLALGVPVFTVGFGEAPESVLSAIATATGGTHFAARDAADVQAAFSAIVAALRCEQPANTFEDTLLPGQVVDHAISVPPDAAAMRVTATWSQGTVTVELIDPIGSRYGPTGPYPPGISYSTGGTFVTFEAIDPTIGGWRVRLTASPDTPPGGLRVISQITLRGGRAASASVPIVLVPGLFGNNQDVDPDDKGRRSCDRGKAFAAMCRQLRQAGHDVFVVSSSPGGRGTVLDSRAAIDRNGKALAGYLRRHVGSPALVVGHSMGGLIARNAIIAQRAPALGLYTFGSPHTGSFAADGVVAGSNLPCGLNVPCGVVRAGFRVVRALAGPDAMSDLTIVARYFANRDLAGRGVKSPPTWLLAGTKVGGRIPDPTDYLFPNDAVVGLSSAHARGVAGLEAANRTAKPLYHTREVPLTPIDLVPNFFDTTDVPSAVGAAAQTLARPVVQPLALRVGAPPPTPARLTGARGRRAFSVRLSALGLSARLRAPRPIAAAVTEDLFADAAFSISCGSKRVAALPLGPDAWFLPRDLLRCPRPVIRAGGPLNVVQTVSPADVRATLVRARRGTRITVRASRPVVRATATIGRRSFVLRGRGGVRAGGIPARFRGRDARIAATVAGATYATSLRLP